MALTKSTKIFYCLIIGLLLQSCSSTSAERFLGLSWRSHRAEVMDSVRAWGFARNEAKARWEGGTISGFACNKLKLGFDSSEHLNFLEARFEDRSQASADSVRSFFLAHVTRVHGDPHSTSKTADAQIPMTRHVWRFSDVDEALQDMIILLHFSDKVIYQTGRNLPPVFKLKE